MALSQSWHAVRIREMRRQRKSRKFLQTRSKDEYAERFGVVWWDAQSEQEESSAHARQMQCIRSRFFPQDKGSARSSAAGDIEPLDGERDCPWVTRAHGPKLPFSHDLSILPSSYSSAGCYPSAQALLQRIYSFEPSLMSLSQISPSSSLSQTALAWKITKDGPSAEHVTEVAPSCPQWAGQVFFKRAGRRTFVQYVTSDDIFASVTVAWRAKHGKEQAGAPGVQGNATPSELAPQPSDRHGHSTATVSQM